MNIPIGLWLYPAVITAASFFWAWRNEDRKPSSDYGNIGKGIGNAMIYGLALIVSLMAWLIWALAT